MAFDVEKGRYVSFKSGERENFFMNPSATPDPRTGWVDWGGDKVWVVPQNDWRKRLGRVWPPGNDLEGLPWRRSIKGGYRWETRVRPANVHVERSHMGGDVRTVVTAEPGGSNGPVHAWCVGQVPAGEMALIGFGEGGLKEAVWFGKSRPVCQLVADASGKTVAMKVLPGPEGAKVGTMGGWVAAVYKDRVLVREILGPVGKVGEYADQSSVQVFVTREYWELETLSPARVLAAGESVEMRERWHAWERPAGMSDGALVAWIERRLAEDRRVERFDWKF